MVKAEVAMETTGVQLTSADTYESFLRHHGKDPSDAVYQTKLHEFNEFVKFAAAENNGGGEPPTASPIKPWDVHMGCQSLYTNAGIQDKLTGTETVNTEKQKKDAEKLETQLRELKDKWWTHRNQPR